MAQVNMPAAETVAHFYPGLLGLWLAQLLRVVSLLL